MNDKRVFAYFTGGGMDLTKISVSKLKTDDVIFMQAPFDSADYSYNSKSGMFDQIRCPDVLIYQLQAELSNGDRIYRYRGIKSER